MSKSKNANQLSNSIIRAIYSNNIDAIKLWQNKDVIDQFDKSNRTAIFHAVLADSKDMLAQLFKDSPDLCRCRFGSKRRLWKYAIVAGYVFIKWERRYDKTVIN
jgi:hypothetical protein